jgi:ribosomal subunit interface protein
MKIRLTARNLVLTEPLRLHVRRRVALALGRFGDRIAEVSVRLTGTEAGHGPSQKHCRIAADLSPRPVSAEDADVDPFAAADGAIDRLSRSVARALEREHDTSVFSMRSAETSVWPTSGLGSIYEDTMDTKPRLTKQGIKDLNHYGPKPVRALAGAPSPAGEDAAGEAVKTSAPTVEHKPDATVPAGA